MALNDTFLQACMRQDTDYTPVWFMRQAGRSLPGYRNMRKKYGVLELTQTPELAAQVSMEPIELLGVDAAILFADIMLLPIALGMDVKIVESVGPVIDSPITTSADVKALQPFDPNKIEFLQQTIRLIRSEVNVPVIGFAGAPFTVASYLIEGQPSRQWHKTKFMMYDQPQLWHSLMTKLSEATVEYLKAQAEAGAQALQLFDSWIGALSAADYRHYILPYVQKIFKDLKPLGVPRIYFGTDTAALLLDINSLDAEVIGLDWRIDLNRAKELLPQKALQGNLDPTVLLASEQLIKQQVDGLFAKMPDRKGWIFNLGHGVLPQTDDKKLKMLVDYVHGKK